MTMAQLWGGRFTKQTDQLVFDFNASITFDKRLFHEDVTGKEITGTLYENAKKRKNITILEYTAMLDILEKDNCCYGIVMQDQDGTIESVQAKYTVFACGGLGGLYRHSTNFRHITGDALAIAKKHAITLEHVDYIQIHPTTLYSFSLTSLSASSFVSQIFHA